MMPERPVDVPYLLEIIAGLHGEIAAMRLKEREQAATIQRLSDVPERTHPALASRVEKT